MQRSRARCTFFFTDTATTEIYTLSLHDALPIFPALDAHPQPHGAALVALAGRRPAEAHDIPPDEGRLGRELHVRFEDRKSTRLNSSHSQISYAVFCLKKKKETPRTTVLESNPST